MIKTQITRRTHPELYECGIIITNAPYRMCFYRVEKFGTSDPHFRNQVNNQGRPIMDVISKNGIQFART
jgi:hypothetical protein